MMNIVSLNERGLQPIESRPAEVQDYELCFFGHQGMAEARHKEGASFHGVLHKMTHETMAKLDKSEGNVTRKPAKAKLYDGSIVDCCVYAEDKDKKAAIGEGTVSNPPPRRYVEIMIEGAKHFKVKAEYITFLENHETVPRKPIADLK